MKSDNDTTIELKEEMFDPESPECFDYEKALNSLRDFYFEFIKIKP